MIEDEPPVEPTRPQPAEAATDDAPPRRRKDAKTAATEDPAEPIETADKTDMSAVGDDGQVFGG
jgi:hypothetical protein